MYGGPVKSLSFSKSDAGCNEIHPLLVLETCTNPGLSEASEVACPCKYQVGGLRNHSILTMSISVLLFRCKSLLYSFNMHVNSITCVWTHCLLRKFPSNPSMLLGSRLFEIVFKFSSLIFSSQVIFW